MVRRIGLALTAGLIVALGAVGPALAGGSWFRPIEADLEPGDRVTMVGFSGFASGEPGETFYGYLHTDPDTTPTAVSEETVSDLLPLGPITVTDGGECCWANYRLHITFTIPADLEPGYYEFLHCNDPCTTLFGELISGAIAVGDPSGQVPGAPLELADRSFPAVAELIGLADGPDELASTGWDPGLIRIGVGLGLAGVLLVLSGGWLIASARWRDVVD